MRSNKWAVDDEIAALATYWMAESMYEVRKFSEAIDKFQAFLTMPAARKTGVYNFANYALGYAYFEDENYYKSAFYFENFLKGKDIDENTKNDASLRLADAYFVQKNYPSALLNYNKIIENASSGEDYALFQRGMIQGLQGENDAKIATHEALLAKYIGSNYADDASFEIANTYFIKGDFERAKTDLNALLSKYPRSSYVARALVTIGLVQYNQDANDAALETFKKVVNEYSVTDEAQQALAAIKNIYMDKSDADGYLAYANTTNIGNLSVAEQDNLTFQAVNNRFTNGETQTAVDAVDAYFDKFPNAIHTKQARFIRAECLVKLQKPDLAISDYEFILNDWTSDYTERALISIAKIYLIQKKYNEAIVHLKKLELTSEYRANYGFAVNNLMESYASLSQADETLKYAELVKNFEKSSEEDKLKANLFAAKAYLLKNDLANAFPNFKEVSEKTKTILAAEARYQMAAIQFQQGEYKAAQQTAFDLIKNLPSFDYWVAKSFLLLADTYLALKDEFQAKSTLQSLLDNYTGNDEIIPAAKEKLEALNKKN
jgi:TolA-binding protein